MAISPTHAGFTNTGHDLAVTVVGPEGTAVTLTNVMQFDSRQETADITRVRLDNSVLVADLPKLWTGTITFERGNLDVDDAVNTIEENWFAGQDYILGTVTISVANTQEHSTITFYDASIRFEDAGSWKGDDTVTCRLSFRAGRRIVG